MPMEEFDLASSKISDSSKEETRENLWMCGASRASETKNECIVELPPQGLCAFTHCVTQWELNGGGTTLFKAEQGTK